MPYSRVDIEAYEHLAREYYPEGLPPDLSEHRPSGEFEYRAASGRFERSWLGPVAREMLDALAGAGATQLRVRYDGGYDEGFVHPELLRFGTESRPAAAALRDLTTPELIARIRVASGRPSQWGNASELYAAATPQEAAAYALEELGAELASKLLGTGFGTGDYELYGAFTADLTTGELVDDPGAAKPERME